MNAKPKIALILVLGLGLLAWLVALPAFRFSEALNRYQLGMPYRIALKQASQPFQVYTSGVVFPQGPTEEQKRIFSLYDVTIPKESIYLEFNHYEKLIAVHPLNSPWHSLKQKLSEDAGLGKN